jgi:ankyrin repeat protein
MCVLQYGGWVPLHLASFNGNLGVVRYLIEECGADVHAKNRVSEFGRLIGWINLLSQDFNTKRYICHFYNCVECVLQYGESPLHLVSSSRYLNVVQYLIEKCGADVNAKDNVSEFD